MAVSEQDFIARVDAGNVAAWGKKMVLRPHSEGASSATRLLAYLHLGNLRVVKAYQLNLMWLGFHLRAIQWHWAHAHSKFFLTE
jgi:hypothetical protein